MEQILLANDIPKETVAAIMMLYKNTKVKVGSPDENTDFCNILTSDPAELSNKKCTGVNNSCIQSKISGDNCGLTVDGLNWVQMRRSLKQVGVKQLYN